MRSRGSKFMGGPRAQIWIFFDGKAKQRLYAIAFFFSFIFSKKKKFEGESRLWYFKKKIKKAKKSGKTKEVGDWWIWNEGTRIFTKKGGGIWRLRLRFLHQSPNVFSPVMPAPRRLMQE